MQQPSELTRIAIVAAATATVPLIILTRHFVLALLLMVHPVLVTVQTTGPIVLLAGILAVITPLQAIELTAPSATTVVEIQRPE